ncbi:15197_t:CDS:2, partial [Entrophospora sp. SA101]
MSLESKDKSPQIVTDDQKTHKLIIPEYQQESKTIEITQKNSQIKPPLNILKKKEQAQMIIAVPTIPLQFLGEINKKSKLKENYEIGEVIYNQKNKVEKIEEIPNIKSYATLSYAYGLQKSEENLLTRGAKKSLTKAIEAFEKGEEVKRMRNYYNNSDATLISIQRKLGDKSLENALREIISGWKTYSRTLIYYKDEYNSNDTVILSLSQVLKEVKKRKRSLPIDGIYSVLGMLPYGEKVEVNYSASLEQALYNVMKTAVENDSNGSTSIEGGVILNLEKLTFQPDGNIKIVGLEYEINNPISASVKWDTKSSIESNTYRRTIGVESNGKVKIITLLGTKETLQVMDKKKEGEDIRLLLFNKKKEQENEKIFSLLVARKGNIRYRLGLVESDSEDLTKRTKRQLSISSTTELSCGEEKVTKFDNQQKYQSEPMEDTKNYTPERLLNEGNEQSLISEYQTYQQQAKINKQTKEINAEINLFKNHLNNEQTKL